jgi:rhodanese-related sulfurtransferase
MLESLSKGKLMNIKQRTLSLGVLLALIAGVAPARAADLKEMLANHDTDSFKIIHVADLSALMAQGHVMIFDANTPDTRTDEGVIPGAHLLNSAGHYDVATMLPADKATPLVFYCHNTACMASHAAAGRAVKAGYTDVNVMADGITGWKAAGKAVASASKD